MDPKVNMACFHLIMLRSPDVSVLLVQTFKMYLKMALLLHVTMY